MTCSAKRVALAGAGLTPERSTASARGGCSRWSGRAVISPAFRTAKTTLWGRIVRLSVAFKWLMRLAREPPAYTTCTLRRAEREERRAEVGDERAAGRRLDPRVLEKRLGAERPNLEERMADTARDDVPTGQ